MVDFFERTITESTEDFIRLYLGYESQIKEVFNDADKTIPDLKMILEELAKEDNNELKRLVGMFPDLFNIISPDLIQ